MIRSLTLGAPIDGLLDRLYAQNLAQDDSLAAYFSARAAEGSLDWNNFPTWPSLSSFHGQPVPDHAERGG